MISSSRISTTGKKVSISGLLLSVAGPLAGYIIGGTAGAMVGIITFGLEIIMLILGSNHSPGLEQDF